MVEGDKEDAIMKINEKKIIDSASIPNPIYLIFIAYKPTATSSFLSCSL